MAFAQTTAFQKAFFAICAFSLGFLILAALAPWDPRLASVLLQTPAQASKASNHTLLTLRDPLQEPPTLDDLLHIMQTRLQNYSGPKLNWTKPACPQNVTGARPCYDSACPGHFSPSLKVRLRQLLDVARAHRPLPSTGKYLQALAKAAEPVSPHQYILVTGASSNHYQEMQALFHNVFHVLSPKMQGKNYTFVVYNLGLTVKQRELTLKYCRCTLIDFPFAALPAFVKQLKCYVWKPLIVASLLEKAEHLVWMDASIRWMSSTPLDQMFGQARARGYLTRVNSGAIAVRSQPEMAAFFGDHLCQYAPFVEMETGLGFYHNDRVMREVILKPWLACAFDRRCMCPANHGKVLACRMKGRKGQGRYGSCHRFEQSSIGMIMSRLLLEFRPMTYIHPSAVKVQRGKGMNWFESD